MDIYIYVLQILWMVYVLKRFHLAILFNGNEKKAYKDIYGRSSLSQNGVNLPDGPTLPVMHEPCKWILVSGKRVPQIVSLQKISSTNICCAVLAAEFVFGKPSG
jgi:hypothetical protein